MYFFPMRLSGVVHHTGVGQLPEEHAGKAA